MMKRTLATTIVGRQRAVCSSMPRSSRMVFPRDQPTAFRAMTRAMATSGRHQQHQQQHHYSAFASLLRSRSPGNASASARYLSTEIRAQTAAVAAANASLAAEAEASASGTAASAASKKADSNVFLDNLGKIFLLGIVSVIGTLVRSSYNTSNRNIIRDKLEELAAIDPKELEEFREANSELTLDTMRQILSIYYQEYARSSSNSSGDSGPTSSYGEFVTTIRTIMATRFPKQDNYFTIQMGHYLDRIVVDILEQRGEGSSSGEVNNDDELPVALYFVAMASAMNGPISDRIRILHELLLIENQQHHQHDIGTGMNYENSSASSSTSTSTDSSSTASSRSNGTATANSIPIARVRDVVGYLQETWQLPPDTQIVPTERKYPTQQWRRATPWDIVPDTPESDNDNNNNNDNNTDDDSSGSVVVDVDLVEFAAILRTKSVCAWGECYVRWKPDASEFETAASPEAALPSLAETSFAH